MGNTLRGRRVNRDMEWLDRIHYSAKEPIWSHRCHGRSKNCTQKHETRQQVNNQILERIPTGCKRNRTGWLHHGRMAIGRNKYLPTSSMESRQRWIRVNGRIGKMGYEKRNQIGNTSPHPREINTEKHPTKSKRNPSKPEWDIPDKHDQSRRRCDGLGRI